MVINYRYRETALAVAMQQPPLIGRAHFSLPFCLPWLLLWLWFRLIRGAVSGRALPVWLRELGLFPPIFGSAKATFRHFGVVSDFTLQIR